MFKGGFHIAKIFGIEINADFSWLLIFLLVTFNLAFGVFPGIHPEWGFLLNLTVGLIASLLFFSSVLAHELAHSLVARSRGIPVNKITLFLFGGVSNVEREPDSPGSEFVMAVVGPLTSILLGAIFLFLASLGAPLTMAFGNPATFFSQLGPVTTLLLWLGPINILLGFFNLIPGFPLDGGRILRSIIWKISGDLKKSTRVASLFGQGIAWLFIIAGISMIFGINIPFFGTGIGNGLWLIFIGWFLNNMAERGYQEVVFRDVLGGVLVSEVMRTDIEPVSPETAVYDLVYGRVLGTDKRAFPVMENDSLAGIVCLDDVRKVAKDDWRTKKVEQIMTEVSKLDTVSPEDNASFALEKIAKKDVCQLPVMRDKKIVGLISRRDILLWLQFNHEGREINLSKES
ncbi:site-2 protease family protein [Candidatus Microgenomates bacterium]|jgi:Zn-dependent protease/CBS domain-containing protein|nr:MAG: site-2 protease family protein [Candidatus Microgenomates bacterium]